MGWQQHRRKKSLVLVGHYRTLCGPVNKTRVDLSYCNRNSHSNHPSDLTNKNFEKNQHLPSAFDWYSSFMHHFKGSSQTNSTLSNLIMKKRLALHRDIQEFDLKKQLLSKSLTQAAEWKNGEPENRVGIQRRRWVVGSPPLWLRKLSSSTPRLFEAARYKLHPPSSTFSDLKFYNECQNWIWTHLDFWQSWRSCGCPPSWQAPLWTVAPWTLGFPRVVSQVWTSPVTGCIFSRTKFLE